MLQANNTPSSSFDINSIENKSSLTGDTSNNILKMSNISSQNQSEITQTNNFKQQKKRPHLNSKNINNKMNFSQQQHSFYSFNHSQNYQQQPQNYLTPLGYPQSETSQFMMPNNPYFTWQQHTYSQAHSFYSTNDLNSKQGYLNHRSYIQAKKAENRHKLWPHSVNNNKNNIEFDTKHQDVMTKQNADKEENKAKSKNEKSAKSNIAVESSNSVNTENTANTNNNSNLDIESSNNSNKTAMCLINELVKFNKIKHEYILLDEIGPAHKKIFFVTLKLALSTENEESYSANGTSIKKAQHAAAESALKQTKFKKPPTKQQKQQLNQQQLIETKNNPNDNNDNNDNKSSSESENKSQINSDLNKSKKVKSTALPPTVLLNTLAMKLGLVANYKHTLTTSANNYDYTANNELMINDNTKNQESFDQQNSHQHQFESNTNYTNFTNVNYEPFRYPSVQIYTTKHLIDNLSNNLSSKNYRQQGSENNSNDNKIIRKHQYVDASNQNHRGQIKNYHYSFNKQLYLVQLKFAEKEFNGQGSTLQLAKHDAASKALKHFSNAENFLEAKKLASNNSAQNKSAKAYRPPQFYKKPTTENETTTSENDINKIDLGNNVIMTQVDQKLPENLTNKSEIMILNEYGYRLKKLVKFELISESGPSHIKKYVTKCSIGTKEIEKETETEDKKQETVNESNNKTESLSSSTSAPVYLEVTGEGNSKKESKKNSAIQMIKILKEKFEPLLTITAPSNTNNIRNREIKADPGTSTTAASDSETNIGNKKSRKNKAKNIVKLKKTSPDYGKGSINPISRLIQIQQAKKEKEPIFELLNNENEKKSAEFNKRPEFIMKVTLQKQPSGEILECEGKGCTKKLAKQNAAELMLAKLGYQSKTQLQSSLKTTSSILKSTNFKTNSNNVEKLESDSLKTEILTEIKAENEENFEKISNQGETKNGNEEKNEKRVKFVENVIITYDKLTPSTKNLDLAKPPKNNVINSNNNNPNNSMKNQFHKQKLKQLKEQSNLSSISKTDYNSFLGNKQLLTVFKIAHELLDSVKTKSNNNSDNPDSSKFKNLEFYSETAESLSSDLSKLNLSDHSVNVSDSNIINDIDKEIENTKFKILTGSSNAVNYKKMLDYLAEKMQFKVIFQSLLGRDGSVISYVNLSIMTETEKPLNGQGATHIESSNAAAFCALEYLASKHSQINQKKPNAIRK